MKKEYFLITTLVALFAVAGVTQAQVILHDGTGGSSAITGTAGTVFVGQGSTSNYFYNHLFEGINLTKVNPSDPTTWEYGLASFSTLNGWLTNGQLENGGGASAINFVDIDLGGTYELTNAHIWNWNADNNQWYSANVTLIFSENAIFGDGDDTSQALVLPSNNPSAAGYTGEHFTLTPVADVTNVRLIVDGGTRGLSEVAFTAIPEPSSFALMMLGLGGLYLLRRRS
jgi:hypothetical protein